MARVDEALEERQAYGNASGWSARQTTQEPASRSAAAQPAPPAEDASAAPSAATVEETTVASPEPVSEQAPPPSSQPAPEKTWHEPPQERWEELRQQRIAAEQRAAALERQNQLLVERMTAPPAPPVPPQPDFWAGKVDHPDAATAQFYQQQRQMFDLAVQQAEQRAVAQLQPVIQAGMQKLAAIDLKAFRQENPDIKPGSEDEATVIAYMEGRVDGLRHPIESARNNAIIKRLETENAALKSKQALLPSKRAAAVTEGSAGIPATAGLPGRPTSASERTGAAIDQGASFRDVVRTFFGMR